jgi:hypothetical protein
MNDDHVLVTTDKRGVFFGRMIAHDGDTIKLADCQMCVYWSADVHGVMGLAANGPTSGSRVSAPTPETELNGVTSISKCSEAAIAAWKAQPWHS